MKTQQTCSFKYISSLLTTIDVIYLDIHSIQTILVRGKNETTPSLRDVLYQPCELFLHFPWAFRGA